MELEDLGTAERTTLKTIVGKELKYSLMKSYKRIGGRYSYSVTLEETSCGQRSFIFASDVSRIRKRAYEIFRLISEGSVTACTFFEVLEDLL